MESERNLYSRAAADEKQIKRFNPSKANPETYGISKLHLDTIAPTAPDIDVNAPFDPSSRYR